MELLDGAFAMMPATGWYAVFVDDGGEFWQPLAAWALCHHDVDGETYTAFVGIDPSGEGWGGEVAEEIRNFLRYDHESNRLPPLRI